jgi:MFS family permease
MISTVNVEDRQSGLIEWKQIWSLAALYASIIIGWIAYHNYQPKLLVMFQFEQYALLLAVIQAIILVITPIYAGRLGDRFRFKRGHRLPIISTGISFAAMVFMAVAFTLISNPGEIFKWILPVLIVCWLIAMSIFTSPALSTLELFTPVDKLPRAMAVLTIVSNLVYALEPIIVDIIDYIGAPLTFIAGGAVVFLAGWSLRRNSLGLFKQNEGKQMAVFTFDTQKSQYARIFLMGIMLGLATTFLFDFFPDAFEKNLISLMEVEGKWWVVILLVISAIISVPVSNKVISWGIDQTYLYSIVLVALASAGIWLIPSLMVTLLSLAAFTLGFTVLSVISLPLVVSKSNYYEKVFCVGIFFSGVELPEGIIESILMAMN